tara:strand:- start:684 stop:2096 length:1413 start_codon:yes stop_codon:yes gene_type:complete
MTRVRFAPSPTGYLHIGGLRTALYNYLFAKQNNGSLILRIEDTDRTRLVDGAVENLISTLEWLGIEFDEGPHTEGNFGPYVQSERLSIYNEHVLQLIKDGCAYPCFYPQDRLDTIKEKNIPSDIVAEYDKRFRDVNISESIERMSSENHVVRLKVPSHGNISINDQIRGKIDFDLSLIQDQIIIKSDGYPTYHLASVVDDHLMQISHVIRGEEWIASLPKHGLLYQSFGWDLPDFLHLPLLLNQDKSKLSKRQGDVAVEDYKKNGYLKEALVNYVALLGWHGSDNKEIYNISELFDSFSIDRIKSSGAIFDVKKLIWFNQQYIKNTDSELLKIDVEKTIPSDWNVTLPMIDLVKDSVDTLNDFKNQLESFFVYSPISTSNNDKLFSDMIYDFLNELKNKFETIDNLTVDKFKQIVNTIKNTKAISGNVWKPIRIAVSGKESGPDISMFIVILGPDQCSQRIGQFLNCNVN